MMVAEALTLLLATDVAVMVRVVPAVMLVAVKSVAAPLAVLVAESEPQAVPPQVAVQVTPLF